MRLFLLLFSLGFVSESSGQSIYYVRFPNDTFIEQCSNPGFLTNAPQFYNPDSLNLAVETYYTFWGQIVPACFSLERSWKIYDVAKVPFAGNLPAGYVRFGNLNTPNYNGGELRAFDNRPVLSAERYIYSLQHQFDSNGSSLGVFLRWRYWQNGEWKLAIPQLPPGNHYIEWSAGDACGNDISCHHPFTVSAVVPVRGIPDVTLPNRLSNTPNPFREQTTLRFNLPLGGKALLAIHDLHGHLLWSSTGLFDAGDQQVVLNSAMTGHASGLLRFSVQTEQGSASRVLLALPADR